MQTENGAEIGHLSKASKIQQNRSKVRFWAEKGQKARAPVVDFREPRPQGAAPSTRTRQKKEGDGRKKEEPRKKE